MGFYSGVLTQTHVSTSVFQKIDQSLGNLLSNNNRYQDGRRNSIYLPGQLQSLQGVDSCPVFWSSSEGSRKFCIWRNEYRKRLSCEVSNWKGPSVRGNGWYLSNRKQRHRLLCCEQ